MRATKPASSSKRSFGSTILIGIIALVIGMSFSGCGTGGPDVKIVDGVASFEERLHPYSRAEIFAFTMGGHVYDVAKQHPEVKKIIVTLTFPGLTDKYGKPLEQDFVMGTIAIADLDEVRRYADDGAYGNEAQSLYSRRIKAMPCAHLLKQDK